ncbi:hypothetical protein NEOLEDRAFT_1178850 [Neolentinus lepideus HHB14362 ss-1]|uniref:Uncharacterized protein n=1 Tax=Neolentinus lepideus HHB14362 ss-1 TaxID=1314782 RepID=A0A165S720_9AGAM|nr:hypothetical protein NEOLEDRAFT_1178850 [Neolentinus lepideus HHB14362 ss-1]
MTEYDYSPEAYQRAMATHNRVNNWVVSQTHSRSLYNNPFQLTRSEAAERAAVPLYASPPSEFPGSPGLFARDLEMKRTGRERSISLHAGGAGGRRNASANTHGYVQQREAYRPTQPVRSKTYSLAQQPPQPPPHSHSQSTSQSSSPHRSNSLSHSHTSSRNRSPTKPSPVVYYPKPVYAYPHPTSAQTQARQPVVYSSPPQGYYAKNAGVPYVIGGKVVALPPGQGAYVYPGGDVRVMPSRQATPATLKKKGGQPFLKRLFTGWGSTAGSRDRRRRMSY